MWVRFIQDLMLIKKYVLWTNLANWVIDMMIKTFEVIAPMTCVHFT